MEHKFFRCKHCGNLIGLINNAGVPMICCGEPMEELVPNTVEASGEKHIPVVTVSGGEVTVTIGSVPHPTEEKHHIEFVYLATKRGGQRKSITPGKPSVAKFALVDDEPTQAFAYCNLHGLWKTDL